MQLPNSLKWLKHYSDLPEGINTFPRRIKKEERAIERTKQTGRPYQRSDSLIWVTPTTIQTILPKDELPQDVGEKALGLLYLPRAWVPPFFVLSPSFRSEYAAHSLKDRRKVIKKWHSPLMRACRIAGLSSSEMLYIRSNAVTETISERGKHNSIRCDRKNLLSNLSVFFDKSIHTAPDSTLGVVIQEYKRTLVRGQLSNVRRVAKEYRDGLIELSYPVTGEMTEERISVRRWRKPQMASTNALMCRRPDELATVLREPLALATEAKTRVLYEWIWDGRFIHIVQADLELEPSNGVSPEPALSDKARTASPVFELQIFRTAKESDAQRFSKLRCHFLYAKLGFSPPPLYVLDDINVLKRIFSGKIDRSLSRDLDTLTQQPLMIRTSTPTPSDILLPRSDQLRSSKQAAEWLTNTLPMRLHKCGLQPGEFGLIAHHFIAARAAALSKGDVSNRTVDIEAIWGIPEGLYYYPCDAYKIDTQKTNVKHFTSKDMARFAVFEERRYKGHFVAPNMDGEFVVHSTRRPWDWGQTLSISQVREIAYFTRRLAEKERRKTTIMWFINRDSGGTKPSILPWYHDSQPDIPGAEIFHYQRNSHDERRNIQTLADIDQLELQASENYHPAAAHRLIISLNPIENQLIREIAVAERVGAAAHKMKAIVELQGGILSHIYYVLKRTGADIAIKNPPRFSTWGSHFSSKLVRDNIPSAVAEGGEKARIARLTREELKIALKAKLIEEAFEVRDAASAQDLVQELADVLEVVDSLISVSKLSRLELKKVREIKLRRRGGFQRGIVLLETRLTSEESPDSASDDSVFDPLPKGKGPGQVIETRITGSLEGAKGGPTDLRIEENLSEIIQTASVSLVNPEWQVTSSKEIRLNQQTRADSIDWTLEGKREGTRLRLRLKIRIGSKQLGLPLDYDLRGRSKKKHKN